ncbi:MAG: TRAP transporter substrate-binding protein DctP [Pseudomonadota bacterium]
MIIARLSKYAAVSTLAMCLTGAGAMAEQLKLLSSWASNQATYRVNVETFVSKVQEYTNGGVSFSIIGPESISPLEQVEPLQTGIVDLVFSHPAYHAGTSKIGMGADGIAVDPTKWRETGIFDAFDDYYQTLGIKVIGIMPLGESGFRFVTNQAVDGREHSFDGMKLRANASYINIIEKLGGSPVPLAGGEIYSSLQNGVIDGAPWGAAGIVDFKLYEVASHVLQPDFGSLSNWMFMNLDKWNGLDAETQEAITKAAYETELFALGEITRIAAEELVTLQEEGMAITTMNAEEQANIDNWMSDAMWGLAMETDAEIAGAIREKAIAAGLSQ